MSIRGALTQIIAAFTRATRPGEPTDRARAGARRSLLLWIALGAAGASLVMLRDINGLLASIEARGSRSFDAGVFTSARLAFWSTDDLTEALRLWQMNADVGALRLLQAHATVDLLFIAASYPLLRRVVRWAVHGPAARVAVGAVIVSDLAETAVTLLVFRTETTATGWLIVVQLLSLVKWLARLATVVVIVVEWRAGRSPQRETIALAARRVWADRLHTPALSVGPQTALVVVFGVLVALPAGGPLEQLPDILRYQVTGAPLTVKVLSVVSLLVFAATIAVSGLIAHRSRRSGPRPVPTGWIVTAAVAITLGLTVAGLGWDDRVNPPAFAVLILVVGLWLAAVVADQFDLPTPPDPPGPRAEDPGLDNRTVRWIGGLAGLVIVMSGVGLVRAASPFVLLGTGGTQWWFVLLGGFVTAVAAGAVAQATVSVISHRLELHTAGAPAWVVAPAVGIVVVAGALAAFPGLARHLGTTGAVAIGFAFYAVIIAAAQAATRAGARWSVTTRIGLGPRTPWGVLLIAVFVLASFMNSAGGYHDVRTMRGPENAVVHRHDSLDAAFRAWRDAPVAAACTASGTRPLVLVAAPGGGVRAAYWTARALDGLFADPCARQSLFALSGVSGGAVGSVLWAAEEQSPTSLDDALDGLSGDQSLATAVAGIFFRDMLQPLTGIATGWRDRAALFEDGWIDHTGVLADGDDPLAWSDVGAAARWAPVLVMNSSSVTDGCRILLANVANLAASETDDCLANSLNDGASRAAIDPLPLEHEDACNGQASAAAIALLAARFPYVTPSGSITYCPRPASPDADEPVDDATVVVADPPLRAERRTIHGVDGGYFENSGLLSVLEILEALEPAIRAANQTAGADDPLIEPWIVEVDNHYRSAAAATAASRPLELLVPLITVTRSQVLADTALEQAATIDTEPLRWGLEDDPDCNHFLRLGPGSRPRLTAPLGWVLSDASRRSLDDDLTEALTDPGTADDPSCVVVLRNRMGSAGDS